MSMVRTGHKPGAWRDEGPAPQVTLRGRFGARTHADFVPVVVLPIVQSDAERLRTKNRHKLRGESLAPVRPRCGTILLTRVHGTRNEEPCARTPGHRWEHQSEERMEYIRAQRRARPR